MTEKCLALRQTNLIGHAICPVLSLSSTSTPRQLGIHLACSPDSQQTGRTPRLTLGLAFVHK